MSSAVIAENYSAAKLKEYICFVEQLGSNIHFHENKWVCSNLRRSPAERSCMFTLYFDRIPALHRETVKSFAAISLIRGKKISTVKSYVMDLIRFFDFWSLDKGTLPLSGCDEFAVADFYHYLEKTEFAEATRIGIWSSLSIFFETMNDIDGARSKNPFSVSPYRHQRRYDAKYIPESIAIQLNSVYTRSGQNSTPNSNATNLHSSQKRCCSFCISSSNASPTFQVQKSIFHQMTKPIQVTVILPLLLAISFSRNDDIHSSISGISNDLIGVIPTIGQ